MFQTEFMIGLQSLSSPSLTWLMQQITATGYSGFIGAMVIFVMLGIDLRRGFLLFQIIAWTGMISELCKMFFRLPRSFFADNRLSCLEPERILRLSQPFFADNQMTCLESGRHVVSAFNAQGAATFFSLPPRPVIEAFRLQGLSFGFPSGHVSGSIAMWGGLAVLFRNRRLAWLAPLFISLIAFSRLYLGVHFLGDVLGGILLGGLMLLLACRLLLGTQRQQRFFTIAKLGSGAVLPLFLYISFMFIMPLLLAIFSLIDAAFAGFFIGLNAAFTVLLKEGLPENEGSLPVRAVRVLLGAIFFLLLNGTLRLGLAWLHDTAGSWPIFISNGLGCFLTFWGSLKIFLRMGLYKKAVQATTACK